MSAQPDTRAVRTPGPDHPITIERNGAHVRVWFEGQVIADTHAALTLREASYAPVEYIPLEDVEASALAPSDHQTYCPYKGQASYYHLKGQKDAVWEYREPFPPVAAIRGHVAFYPDRVDAIEQQGGD